MPKLTILTIPQHETALRTKSQEISVDQINTEETQKFFRDLGETMFEADGAGLAAPQVGQLIRAVAINMGESAQIFINPVIVKKSWRKTTMEEGCLSVPGIYGKVKRPLIVTVEYYDTAGNYHKEKLDKIPSRIIQHEADHLEGVLFIDKISGQAVSSK